MKTLKEYINIAEGVFSKEQPTKQRPGAITQDPPFDVMLVKDSYNTKGTLKLTDREGNEFTCPAEEIASLIDSLQRISRSI